MHKEGMPWERSLGEEMRFSPLGDCGEEMVVEDDTGKIRMFSWKLNLGEDII